MSWLDNPAPVQALATSYHPRAKCISKNCWLGKVAFAFYWLLSFGKITRERFFTKAALCVGRLILIPEVYTTSQAMRTVPHECGHVIQQHYWFGLGIDPWVGAPIMFVAQLLPFPVGIAYVRTLCEWWADRLKWIWNLQHHGCSEGSIKWTLGRAEGFGAKMGGPMYFWAVLPKSLAIWFFVRSAKRVIAEQKELAK